MNRLLKAGIAVILMLPAAACRAPAGGPDSAGGKVALRLGYFSNLTHATALVGLEKGILAKNLGSDVKLETQTFSAGGQAIEAIFSGGLDAAYIGPNPAINAFVKSGGQAIRIVAGATSGGAFFVVQPQIFSAADLKGKKVATPQLGATQDVALRSWLTAGGIKIAGQAKPEVQIIPQENAQTLETFRSGTIAGAWVPEPWASRLVMEAGGKVLVDERTLWPDGQYVTTQLIVRTKFMKENPAVVQALVKGHVEANDFIAANRDEAKRVAGAAVARITGKALAPAVIDNAWNNLIFTVDPIASSLQRSAKEAARFGFIDKVDLTGIYDLTYLNTVLGQNGKPAIAVP